MNQKMILSLLVASAGCATVPTKEFAASHVVERVGHRDSTPEWADGTRAMAEEGSDVVFFAQMTMGGNARTEACIKAAELDGRSAMLRYIKEHLSTSGQVNEADASSDPGYESLTAFLSQSKISGVRPSDRYWEKVEQSMESGERALKLRCVVKVMIKKSELQRQLREATVAQGGNPKVRDSLLKAQKEFFDGLDQGHVESH